LDPRFPKRPEAPRKIGSKNESITESQQIHI